MIKGWRRALLQAGLLGGLSATLLISCASQARVQRLVPIYPECTDARAEYARHVRVTPGPDDQKELGDYARLILEFLPRSIFREEDRYYADLDGQLLLMWTPPMPQVSILRSNATDTLRIMLRQRQPILLSEGTYEISAASLGHGRVTLKGVTLIAGSTDTVEVPLLLQGTGCL